MTYDEALAKIESIVKDLERSEALSVTQYKEKAAEAKQLLDYCESCIQTLSQQLA